MGISTGIVFSGVVGTSGSRKEFSVLGDVVNVAARIMGWGKKHKAIYVGLQTVKDSSPFLKFRYVQHCLFKGKSVSLPIYEPIGDEFKSEASGHDFHYPFNSLKLHHNPFMIDRDNKFQDNYCKIYGRDEELDSAFNEIIEF